MQVPGTAETPPPKVGEPRALQPDGIDPLGLYAVTRGALIEALHTGSGHDREGPARTCGACIVDVDRILAAGILRDADEIEADAWRHIHSIDVDGVCQDCERLAGEGGTAVFEQGKAEGAAEVRAKVQALADSWTRYFTPNTGHREADFMLAAANDLRAALDE